MNQHQVFGNMMEPTVVHSCYESEKIIFLLYVWFDDYSTRHKRKLRNKLAPIRTKGNTYFVKISLFVTNVCILSILVDSRTKKLIFIFKRKFNLFGIKLLVDASLI